MAPRAKKKPVEATIAPSGTTPADVCYIEDPISTDHRLVLAIKPAGSIWSAAERGEGTSPFRVETMDLSERDLECFRSCRCRRSEGAIEPFPIESVG